MAKDVDWQRIKVSYVTGKMSYKALAQKHRLQPNAVSRRGREEEWPRLRKEYREKAAARAIEKEAVNEAERLSKLIRSEDAMEDVVLKLFNDARQFYRHIVVDGKCNSEERIFDKADTRAIRDLSCALKDLTYVRRNLLNLPTQAEKEAQRIASERLRMDQKKAEMDENADRNITVELVNAEGYAQ